MIKRKNMNPVPTLNIQSLINMKIEKKMKELEEQVKKLEVRIENLEQKSIVSLSPLPPNTTPTEIKDLYLCNENIISSFDNLE